MCVHHSSSVHFQDFNYEKVEPEPIQDFRPSGLPRRKTRLPKRYRDLLPPPPPVVDNSIVEQPLTTEYEDPIVPVVEELPNISYTTPPNSFGVYRIYKHGAPSYNPDNDFSIHHVADNTIFTTTESSPLPIPEVPIGARHPFSNQSTFRLMTWYYAGSGTKSLKDLNDLVHNVILMPDFNAAELSNFDATKTTKQLDNFQRPSASGTSPALEDGWIKSSVSIRLPCDGFQQTEATAFEYKLEGLLYRKPLEVIKAAYREHHAKQYHLSPFEEYWKPSPDSPPERMYSELYNCDAFLEEHDKIQAALRQSEDDPQIEAVIAPLMIWSDATVLGKFGNASLWPIYMYFGSQSKYTRAKPSAFAAHHLAYIPKVCVTFSEFSYRNLRPHSSTMHFKTFTEVFMARQQRRIC